MVDRSISKVSIEGFGAALVSAAAVQAAGLGANRFLPMLIAGFLLLANVASALAEDGKPLAPQEPLPPTGTTVLWTSEPVRVDRTQQDLPRAPDRRLGEEYPDSLYIPRAVRVPDSVTFRLGDKTYRLVGLKPLPPGQVCRRADGRRFACGLHSRMFLRTEISGRQIRCRVLDAAPQSDSGEGEVLSVRCESRAGVRLDEALLRNGFATVVQTVGPDLAPSLSRIMAQAQARRAGIWVDQDFYDAYQGAASQ